MTRNRNFFLKKKVRAQGFPGNLETYTGTHLTMKRSAKRMASMCACVCVRAHVCACVRARVRVCVCVYSECLSVSVCVCHSEKKCQTNGKHDKRRILAILQISSSKHNTNRNTTRGRGPFHQSITVILTGEKKRSSY